MRTRSFFKALFPLVLVVGVVTAGVQSTAQAQDEAPVRTIGISASIQSDQSDLLFPIWINPSFVLAPAVSVLHQGGVKDEIGLGAALRAYLRPGQTRPYLAGRFGYHHVKVEKGDGTSDYLFGPALGGEYFFHDHFSLGVEAQLNIVVSGEGSYWVGNPDATTINTATAAMASFYF